MKWRVARSKVCLKMESCPSFIMPRTENDYTHHDAANLVKGIREFEVLQREIE